MIITVTDTAGLTAALNSASSGDTIQLAAGDYATFNLKNLNFSGPGVTITSQEPGAQATLTGFQISGSSGLTFRNLEFAVDAAKGDNPFQIYYANNITLEQLNVHGSLDGNGQNDVAGVLIDHSSNVTIRDSEFQELRNAISHVVTDYLDITGNQFHHIRTDGVHGAGSSFVTVSQNFFTNFTPVAGDHGDAIQFFTTGTTVVAHDIVITDNVVMRGAGGMIQGVFMRDEVGSLAYQNVRIDGNLVVGALSNGIGISGAANVTITNNIVGALPDQKSGITLGAVNGGALSGNKAGQYGLQNNTSVTQTGDTTIAAAADGGNQALLDWAASHLDAVGTAIRAAVTGNAAALAVQRIESTRLETVTVNGSDGADVLAANATRNTIVNAGAGNDTIYGGGVGHHTLIGGAGNDTYVVSSEFDNVVEEAGGGVDMVSSTVDYTMTDNVENLRLTGAGSYAVGNALDNKISGSTGGDQIFGMGGSDEIHGFDGNDVVAGGDGADAVFGDAGDDTVSGGAGNDSVGDTAGSNYLRGEDGNDVINGGTGFDDINGNMGADTVHGNGGDDYSVGGKDNDMLFGDAGNDIVWGNLGNDTCDGGDGNDQLRGGQGDDNVTGGAGDDYVSGDRGNDTMTGGAGADVFHSFQEAGIDRVLDFSLAQGDRVQLDAGTSYTTSQVGADTVIDMGGGNQMILAGVQLAGLTTGWIFLG